jgi:hypothetical protein
MLGFELTTLRLERGVWSHYYYWAIYNEIGVGQRVDSRVHIAAGSIVSKKFQWHN